MSDNASLKIWQTLQPMVRKEVSRGTESSVKSKKMVVTTAFNAATKTVGVKEAFGKEIQVPVAGTINPSSLTVGTAVWVVALHGSWSNAMVWMRGDGETGYQYLSADGTAVNAEKLGNKTPEYYAVAADVGMDLLWSNASITSAFPAQTIQLDLTAYRAVIIVFRQSESMPYRIGVFCEVGYYGIANFPVHKFRYRRFTVSVSNFIEFNGAREYASYNASESSAADEANVIPVKIYGIK